MTRIVFIVLSLMSFTAAALMLGAWAARRTHNASDFIVASRRLDHWAVGLGFSASAANAWLMFLLAGAAYAIGAAAVWLALGVLLGCALNLFYVAPRLRIAAGGMGAVTLIQIMTADVGDRLQPTIVRTAVGFAAFLLLLQAAALLSGVSDALPAYLGIGRTAGAVGSVLLVGVCLIAGGLRAVGAFDALQSALMFGFCALLLGVASAGMGGETPWAVEMALRGNVAGDLFAGKQGVVAVAFAGGGLGIALAMCGQPQALHRFIAAREDATLRRARWTALGWVVLQAAAVCACGWGVRLVEAPVEAPAFALLALAEHSVPDWLAPLFIVALLGSVALSLGAPLFALAGSFAVDIRRSSAALSLAWMKVAVSFSAAAVLGLTLLAPANVFEQWLFAFTTLGAVFGPIVLVRASGKRVRPGSMLGAMWSAFALSVIFHLLPDSPGDFLQRVLPFVAALGIALSGGERRRNPDRADRAEQTVHDRIPI